MEHGLAPVIAEKNAIWVQHGNDVEDQVVAKQLPQRMRG